MQNIDINHTLLQRLKTDYLDANDQVKFMNGLDYLEAMVKLFAVINIAVVKEIDEDVYKKILLENFKISPSLGAFMSLAISPFTKANITVLRNKNDFYEILHDIFTNNLSLKLDWAEDIMEENIKINKKNISTLSNVFEYVVNFRNKLKGHGAAFKKGDKQAQIILDNLDTVINEIESQIKILLANTQLSFFIDGNNGSNEEHEALKVFIKYDKIEYKLSPLIIYQKCNKFSCKDDHRVKLFFYNDGKASKSYYIDYSFNHYYYFSSNNEVNNTLEELVTQQKEINAHSTSDNQRQSVLLSVFVGREKELKASQEHIIKNIESNTPSAITIKGKPGIGKSAFISKLQEELTKKVEELQTYIFYAKKLEMGDDEYKSFFDDWNGYLDNIEMKISIPTQKDDERLSIRKKLEYVFEVLNKKLKKPMLLIIDGLDEFTDPDSFLKIFPMQNVPKKLHLVFTTRGYSYILDALQTKLFNSQLDILHKESYMAESVSITLGKLSAYEVEALLSEVLTKDIRKDDYKYKTNIYETIQEELYEKSEGLPLYINYISNKLIEFDLKTSNIGKKILMYAKELPQGLDDFYFQSLRNLELESSQILNTLYFAHKHITFDSFHHLIKQLNESTIDKGKFQKKYFNAVEIFLSKDLEDKYGFYHLSVKEAIKRYFMQDDDLEAIVEIDYEKLKENIHIAEYQEKQYKETFSQYYYLKEDSDLFKLLEGIVNKVDNNKYLKEFYEDNFLTYFYKYINFCNFHEILRFKEMVDKDYTKFENITLSLKTIKQIKEFFETYDISKKQDLNEIKYAHEFALLTNDYDRVLSYSKDYEDAFLMLFIDIIWNLDSQKNQKLFKELKPIWSDLYDDDFKLILLQNIKLCNYLKYMIEIVNSIETVEYRSKELLSIVYRIDDLDKALEITNSIENNQKRSEALVSIASRTNDLDKALEIANLIEDSPQKVVALVSIASKSDDIDKAWKIVNSIEKGLKIEYASIKSKTDHLNKALEIANIIKDDREKAKALVSIAFMNNDLDKALEVANLMEYGWGKSEILASIAFKTDDPNMLEEALKIAHSIQGSEEKANALASIVSETDDLDKALEVAHSMEDDWGKSRAFKSIASRTDDLDKALEIINLMEDDWEKWIEIASIVSRTDDVDKALEIAHSINGYERKSEALASIASRTDDVDKALEIANSIEYPPQKAVAFLSIASKIDDQKMLDEALEIINLTPLDDWKKIHILKSLASKTVSQSVLVNILKYVMFLKDNNEKKEILISIASNTNDLDKALEMINSIEDYRDKPKVLASIVSRTDDQKILGKALEIANSIEYDWQKLEVLVSIVSKTDDQKILDKALEIANSMEYDAHKTKALVSIASKTNDKKILDEALETINSMQMGQDILMGQHILEAFVFIVSKIDDQEMLSKALEIASLFERTEYRSKAYGSIILKTDDLDKALEFAHLIEDYWEKKEALISIVSRTKDLDKALEIAYSINNFNGKSKALLCIVSKTNDLDKALKIAYSIKNPPNKAEALISIASKTDDQKMFIEALEIINLIPITDWEKLQVLVSIVSKTDDQKMLHKVLEIAKSINTDEHKAKLLVSIVSKTDDQKMLVEALEIASSIQYSRKKLEILEFIKSKNNTFDIVNNFLYKFNAALNFNLYESLEYVAFYNEDTILKYYGVLDKSDTQKNNLESILENLYNMKIQRNMAEESEDEELYEKLTNDAIKFQYQIMEDESMLKEILQKLDVSRLAFNKKDILDII